MGEHKRSPKGSPEKVVQSPPSPVIAADQELFTGERYEEEETLIREGVAQEEVCEDQSSRECPVDVSPDRTEEADEYADNDEPDEQDGGCQEEEPPQSTSRGDDDDTPEQPRSISHEDDDTLEQPEYERHEREENLNETEQPGQRYDDDDDDDKVEREEVDANKVHIEEELENYAGVRRCEDNEEEEEPEREDVAEQRENDPLNGSDAEKGDGGEEEEAEED